MQSRKKASYLLLLMQSRKQTRRKQAKIKYIWRFQPFFFQFEFFFRGKVCKFCLYKKHFKLGEDIVGSFDFTVGEVIVYD